MQLIVMQLKCIFPKTIAKISLSHLPWSLICNSRAANQRTANAIHFIPPSTLLSFATYLQLLLLLHGSAKSSALSLNINEWHNEVA